MSCEKACHPESAQQWARSAEKQAAQTPHQLNTCRTCILDGFKGKHFQTGSFHSKAQTQALGCFYRRSFTDLASFITIRYSLIQNNYAVWLAGAVDRSISFFRDHLEKDTGKRDLNALNHSHGHELAKQLR